MPGVVYGQTQEPNRATGRYCMKIEIKFSWYHVTRMLSEKTGKRKFTLMKEDFYMQKFSLKSLSFKLGRLDGGLARFGRFELCDLYKPKYNHKTGASRL